jgi:N-methylhydantoinase A/oxoprolinase/acetone carboxylase beta subunit
MNMVQLVRELTVGQGYDPRDFTLLAFGGNGGQYAAEVAEELGMTEVTVPVNAAVFSALGCLYADIRHEYVVTIFASVEPVTDTLLSSLANAFAEMQGRGRADLANDGVTDQPEFVYEYDVRYVGEAYEIRVAQEAAGTPTAESLAQVVARFHLEHERLYGFQREDPIEILNARLTAIVRLPKPIWGQVKATDAPAPTPTRRRITARGESLEIPVYQRETVPVDFAISGPALIEETQSTAFVPERWTAHLDNFGNLRLRR